MVCGKAAKSASLPSLPSPVGSSGSHNRRASGKPIEWPMGDFVLMNNPPRLTKLGLC